MDVKEILNEIIGLDAQRRTKSAITLENNIYHFDNGKVDSISSISLNKPSIEIERHGDFLQVDICFVSSMDNDLKILWNNVELYGKNMNDLDKEIRSKQALPLCTLTIVPTKLEGKYFVAGENPIFWALTSKKMGQNANVIRLLYKVNNFKFYQNDDANMDQIKQEVKDEIIYENRQKAFSETDANNSNNV